jgi:Fe2+ transport system protein FeoA
MSQRASRCPPPKGCPHEAHVCPLSRVVAGHVVRIKRLAAPPEVTRRLREMGLVEEQQVTLLSRRPNLICLVCNARLGLSADLAEKILVELVPSGQAAD